MEKIYKDLQKERFEWLRRIVEPTGIDLVKVLAGLLGIGISTVYRRLDGTTLLDVRDIQLIQRHFQLPPDFFTSYPSPYVQFMFPSIRHQPESIQTFLSPIHENLKTLRGLPQPYITYSSSEIPFFHYFHFPELAYFKFFLWGGMVWKIPAYRDQVFNPAFIRQLDQQGLPAILGGMLGIYQDIPSTEYWSVNILDNTMNQIRFQYESRRLPDRELALSLMDQLWEMIRLMERQAVEGVKSGTDTGFSLYHNEITHTNNTILVTSASRPVGVFVTYDNPNFMYSQDITLVGYTQEWFRKLEEGSTVIARAGTRQRTRFFKELENRWSEARARLT
ncbi:MAG: hypothetical protein J5I41_08305 [Saprospiraceae bacterium]|nr:hypothetical protein [Saprospiraceae bacterium]